MRTKEKGESEVSTTRYCTVVCFLWWVVFLLSLPSLVIGGGGNQRGHQHGESWYRNRWCQKCQKYNGNTKYKNDYDDTKPDCVTNSHAIEIDFGKKWHETIGHRLMSSDGTVVKAPLAEYTQLIDIFLQ